MIKPVLAWLRKRYATEKTQVAIVEDYHKRFGGTSLSMALEDLRQFCFVDDTTYHTCRKRADQNEGRREVYLHIANMMNLSVSEVKQKPAKEETDDRNAERGPEPTDL